MIDKILEIINEYKMNQLLGDSRFVNKMVIVLVDYYDLHKYLDRVDVISSNSTKNGSRYNSFNKHLIINLSEDYDLKKSLEMKDNYYRWYNLELTATILHEVEHIIQEKYKKEHPHDFESKITERCDILPSGYNIKERIKNYITFRKYARCHDIVPIERMANYNANNTLEEIIDGLDSHTTLDKSVIKSYRSYFDERKAKQLLAGYELRGNYTNSPTMEYLNLIKKDENISIPRELSPEKRLYLGLSLTRDEYHDFSKDMSR